MFVSYSFSKVFAILHSITATFTLYHLLHLKKKYRFVTCRTSKSFIFVPCMYICNVLSDLSFPCVIIDLISERYCRYV